MGVTLEAPGFQQREDLCFKEVISPSRREHHKQAEEKGLPHEWTRCLICVAAIPYLEAILIPNVDTNLVVPALVGIDLRVKVRNENFSILFSAGPLIESSPNRIIPS